MSAAAGVDVLLVLPATVSTVAWVLGEVAALSAVTAAITAAIIGAAVVAVARRRAARRDRAGGVWWELTPPARPAAGAAVAVWQLLGGMLRRHPGPWWWRTRLVIGAGLRGGRGAGRGGGTCVWVPWRELVGGFDLARRSVRVVAGVVAALHAAAHGDPLPRPSRIAAQLLALAGSPRLDHLIATNEVFVALAHHARTRPGSRDGGKEGGAPPGEEPHDGGAALAVWWSERHATAAFGTIVRPDGYGEWVEHGRRVGFFLELDRGTEPLPRLLDKLTGYAHLTELGAGHPVLILLPTTTRETHLHEYLRAHPRAGTSAARPDGAAAASPLVVATAAADHLAITGAGPADPVWLQPHQRHRTRLIDLAPLAALRADGQVRR